MKMEITVTEALELINEIRKQPESLFEMICADIKQTVGEYMIERSYVHRQKNTSIF